MTRPRVLGILEVLDLETTIRGTGGGPDVVVLYSTWVTVLTQGSWDRVRYRMWSPFPPCSMVSLKGFLFPSTLCKRGPEVSVDGSLWRWLSSGRWWSGGIWRTLTLLTLPTTELEVVSERRWRWLLTSDLVTSCVSIVTETNIYFFSTLLMWYHG